MLSLCPSLFTGAGFDAFNGVFFQGPAANIARAVEIYSAGGIALVERDSECRPHRRCVRATQGAIGWHKVVIEPLWIGAIDVKLGSALVTGALCRTGWNHRVLQT
jgi:hypothetical protein